MADTQITPSSNSEVLSQSLDTDLGKLPNFLKTQKEIGDKAVKQKVEYESAKTAAELGAKREAIEKIGAEDKAHYEEVKKEMKPIPEFKPTQDNAMDLGAIFSMVGTMGVALGGSGKLSGLNALNAMGGMLKGYQQGRKDLFAKEQATFDKEMTSMKAANDALLKDLEQYQKLRVTDKEAAMLKAGEIVAKNGPIIKQAIETGQTENALEIAKANAKLHSEIMVKSIKTGLSSAGGGEAYALVNNYGVTPEEVSRLNKDQLPMVAAKIESARVTSELAKLIEENPGSVGIAGTMLAKADKYLPSRYGEQAKNMPLLESSELLKQEMDSDTNVEGTPDQITKARVIAKKALDVVNARALAVSKRLLVSELQMQKGVIGIENMSDASGPTIFKNLAKDDLRSLTRYGISDPTIQKMENKLSVVGSSATPKVASAADVDATAKGQKITVDEAKKRLKAAGFKIEGEQ